MGGGGGTCLTAHALCAPLLSPSSCPSEYQRGQVNLMQISTSVVWCSDVVVNIHFFSFPTILAIVAKQNALVFFFALLDMP